MTRNRRDTDDQGRSIYSPAGELYYGRQVALDSAQRLVADVVCSNAESPGRWIKEAEREWRWRQKHDYFNCWHQTEVHRVEESYRRDEYVPIPHWWSEFEVPRRVFALLHPCLTYRAADLLASSAGAWTMFRTEWVAALFSQWVSDILLRGIMWKLTSTLVDAIWQLTPHFLCSGSSVSAVEVSYWIGLLEAYDWDTHVHMIEFKDSLEGMRPGSHVPVAQSSATSHLRSSL